MPQITYTARRSLGPSHSVGVLYTLTPKISGADRSTKHLRQRQESLSGVVETTFQGNVATWAVRLFPVSFADGVYIREMLDSTADGQEFEFDPYGSLQYPVRPLTVVREDDGYSEERVVQTGRGGNSDFFVYGFQAREV